jgi:hypothetical protein
MIEIERPLNLNIDLENLYKDIIWIANGQIEDCRDSGIEITVPLVLENLHLLTEIELLEERKQINIDTLAILRKYPWIKLTSRSSDIYYMAHILWEICQISDDSNSYDQGLLVFRRIILFFIKYPPILQMYMEKYEAERVAKTGGKKCQ